MPSARAYWKGFIRLSLVTIPVSIYNAVENASEISFRQIHKPSGRRISYEKTVPGLGKVENSDIVKGYEVGKDSYVLIEQDEIETIKLESKQTIDIVQFVDSGEIDYRYFERPYFVAPGGELAGEGYVVIRDALRKTGKVGLAQVTIAGREWLVAIAPLGDGLVMELLRYTNELRSPADYFDEVPTAPPQKEMTDLAVMLITQKTSPFKPEAFEDRYQTALKMLVEEKVKGHAIIAPPEAPRSSKGSNVIDLMEALRRSIGDPSVSTEASASATRKGTSKGANSARGQVDRGPNPASNKGRRSKSA